MRSVLTFAIVLLLASACSEKEINPENNATKMSVEDDPQPPKSNCTGGPNCN